MTITPELKAKLIEQWACGQFEGATSPSIVTPEFMQYEDCYIQAGKMAAYYTLRIYFNGEITIKIQSIEDSETGGYTEY